MTSFLKALGALAIVAVLSTALVADDAPLISAAEADRMARSGEALLVDIRQPWEWRQTGVSPDAHTISMHLPGFVKRIHELTGGDRSATIALICARGGRSARMQHQLPQDELRERADYVLENDGTLDDLAARLARGGISRFAIANPEHAPYGKRAEQALRHRGLWQAIRPRLVLGENVSQAARYALSPDTQGGIVAYSLALAPTLSGRGDHALIPEAWHVPLRQRMVLLKGAGSVAERFYAYVRQPAARAILRRYGFALPAGAGG